jgi:crotonobetaine/carnitine-CoA ligase
VERTTRFVLDRNATEQPEKLAIIETTGRAITYRELRTSARRLANGLHALGIERQEQVLVMLGDHIDSALTFFAVTAAGMVDARINSAFKGNSLRYVCELSGAAVLIIEDEWAIRLQAMADDLPELTTVVVRGGDGANVPDRFRVVRFEDLLRADEAEMDSPAVWDTCLMLSTSGTTGRSKGVLCPHGHVFSMGSFPSLAGGSDEVVLVTLPLFHAAGLLSGVFNSSRVGGTAVLAPFSVSSYWNDVRAHGCTSTVLLGAQADFLYREAVTSGDRDHTLRFAVTVPALPNGEAFEERFGVRTISGYGLTESGTVVSSDGSAPRLSCGKPRSFVEVCVVDEHDMQVPQGHVGEILVRSVEPWVMTSGYHRMPEETLVAMRNQWLHSGDAGYLDEDGNLFFVDRAKDALRRRGENVSSFEVEQYIIARDDVAEAAVVAVASEHTEDEIKAVLILAPGARFDPEAILTDLCDRMPYFMVPRYLEVVDDFPRTSTHKVRKVELRESGVTSCTWDCQAAGFRVGRNGLVRDSMTPR